MNGTRLQRRLALLALLIVTLLVPAPGTALPARAQAGSRTFPETGQTVQGRFLDYWTNHGGLPQQGYPISSEMQERNDTDGKTYTVQYFERAVFELHPENQPPNDVLLSLLGSFIYSQKYPNGAPAQTPNNEAGSQLFTATGHRVGGEFLSYWQTHGGLAQQGYPISDEFQELSPTDGKTYTVQYFERAVFELHSENQPPYNVLLSLLGSQRYDAKYKTPTATPTTIVSEPTATPSPISAPIGTIAATYDLPDSDPEAITYGAGSLWVSAFRGRSLIRMDPQTGTVIHTFTFPFNCTLALVTDSAVWATTVRDTVDTSPTTLVRIDLTTNQITNSYPLTNDAAVGNALILANGSLWAVFDVEGVLKRIDPATGSIVANIPIESSSSFNDTGVGSAVFSIDGDIWTTTQDDQNLVHVDPRTNQVVEKIGIGVAGDAVVRSGDSLWIAAAKNRELVRFDLTTKKVVAALDNVGSIWGLVATSNAIWGSQRDTGTIVRVDPNTNAVLGTLRVVSANPKQYAVGITKGNDGTLWVIKTSFHYRDVNGVVMVIPAP